MPALLAPPPCFSQQSAGHQSVGTVEHSISQDARFRLFDSLFLLLARSTRGSGLLFNHPNKALAGVLAGTICNERFSPQEKVYQPVTTTFGKQ